MTIASESDMLVRRGFFSRGIAEAGWVQYELTGFPHLTKPIFDVSGEFLAVNQTPVDARPSCRAAFRNIKLRQTVEGNFVLHAIRTDSGEHRSYRVDRMQGAAVTSQVFSPRYFVELTSTGPLPVAPSPARPHIASTRRAANSPYARADLHLPLRRLQENIQ